MSAPESAASPATPAAATPAPAAAPQAAAGTPHVDLPSPEAARLAELEGALAAAKQESAANYDRYVRSVADLDNYRKRALRDRDDAAHRASARILEDLLPVLDNLALGLAAAQAANADLKTVRGGMEMIASQLKNALSGHGLKELAPAGQPFDPNQHEAISQQPSPTVPADHVAAVVRTGYKLGERLVRPASVIVSTGPAAAEPAATPVV